jgi:hypothetical protein
VQPRQIVPVLFLALGFETRNLRGRGHDLERVENLAIIGTIVSLALAGVVSFSALAGQRPEQANARWVVASLVAAATWLAILALPESSLWSPKVGTGSKGVEGLSGGTAPNVAPQSPPHVVPPAEGGRRPPAGRP